MTQKWAGIEVAVSGDAQEIVGALMTEVADCYGYTATQTAVTGFLPVDDRLENTLFVLRESLDAAPELPPGADITIRFVAEEDWATAWKQYFKPQRVGRHFVVRPTWETYNPQQGDRVILIDPGMAFGTGLHATTRLCLRALEDVVQSGAVVADMGTGSGILAVGAALLGAARVAAIDNDPVAVRVAEENIEVNGLNGSVTVAEASVPPPGPFDIVVANILADVILGMADLLRSALKPDGVLIASGIIENRADDVRHGLARVGLFVYETRTEGEWVALLARQK